MSTTEPTDETGRTWKEANQKPMAEPKHTPTPWVVAGGGYIESEDGRSVADVYDGGSNDPEVVFATTDLIVNAVNAHADLLAACEVALIELQAELGRGRVSKPAVERLVAAIAKACDTSPARNWRTCDELHRTTALRDDDQHDGRP